MRLDKYRLICWRYNIEVSELHRCKNSSIQHRKVKEKHFELTNLMAVNQVCQCKENYYKRKQDRSNDCIDNTQKEV